MKMTACSAFGYVIWKNEAEVGDVINDELTTNNTYQVFLPDPYTGGVFGDTGSGATWLYVKGRARHTNLVTKAVQDRTPGYCNLDTLEPVGMQSFEFIEPTTYFCLSAAINKDKLPPVPKTTTFKLVAGQSTTLPVGTKLFFADGTMIANGNPLSGPRQVSVNTSDVTVTATSDCYGLLF